MRAEEENGISKAQEITSRSHGVGRELKIEGFEFITELQFSYLDT